MSDIILTVASQTHSYLECMPVSTYSITQIPYYTGLIKENLPVGTFFSFLK